MNTPTDAEAALHLTSEKANFHRLTRLLMCGGVSLLREKFDSFHSPTDLPLRLSDPAIINQLKGARLSKPEWDGLYPSPGTFGKSADFDITLTFRLLRTICKLTKPHTGWDELPNSTDHSLEAELVRIKYYRNSVYAHNQRMEITNSEFFHLWDEISGALLRIARSINNEKRDEWKKAIDELLRDPLTTEEQRYVDELQLWYKNDMDVKDTVDQLQRGNAEVIDQLQQLNQRLDNVTLLMSIVVERVSEGRHMVTTSPAAAAPAGTITVIVPIDEEQLQFEGAEGTSRENIEGDHQDPPTESYIWRVILSPAYNRFLSLVENLKVRLGVSVVSHTEGSLLITVTCSSLEILEGLWEDYTSGNLNNVVQQELVTPDVLDELGLSELKLQTTITEEEYNKCKELFLTGDKMSPSNLTASKPKNVDEIDDLVDMVELMTSLKISPKGCRSLDEMKLRVNQKLTSFSVTMGKEVRIF